MKGDRRPDLAACRHWRASMALGAVRVGLIPAWNAVTLLNPAAADIWDLLIATGDAARTAALYAQRRPSRAAMAEDDVTACLNAWAAQGLFQPPAPSPEQREIARRKSEPMPPLPMPAFRRTLRAGAAAITVEIADPALARAVADQTADFPEAPSEGAHLLRSSGPAHGWALHVDGDLARLARSMVEARGQIVAELVRLAAGATPWRATLHGAVLDSPHGAVLLTGGSGAGKSTLAAGLVAQGWKLVAEDYAPFDADMRAHPLPFALSIKDGGLDPVAARFPSLASAPVHQLGARRVRYQGLPAGMRAERPVRPALVVDVRYSAGQGTGALADVANLCPAEVLSLFLNEESYIDFTGDGARTVLDFAAATSARRITYGSTEAAARAITDALVGPPSPGRG